MLVYGLTEHREVDKLASWKKYVLEQYIKEWKKISVVLLKSL